MSDSSICDLIKRGFSRRIDQHTQRCVEGCVRVLATVAYHKIEATVFALRALKALVSAIFDNFFTAARCALDH